MNADSRLWAVLAFAGAVVVAAIAAGSGWWALLWAAAPLGLGGLIVLLLRPSGALGRPQRVASASEVGWPADANAHPVTEEPPAPRRTHLAKSPLTSSHPEYDVLLSAVVCWRAECADDPGYAGRAAALILERAAALTAATTPQDYETTRHRLAAELGREVRAEPERIAVWAEEVRLELHDDDAARLQRIRDFRKDEEIRGYERAAERSYRHYLRDDMLADPGQAVLWWLARDPDQIHDTVNEIGTLSRLSAAASGTEVPALYRDLAGETDDTGPDPLFGTPVDGGPGGPDAPLTGFPGGLFGEGAPGHDGGDGDSAGTVTQHSGRENGLGEDPREAAKALADLFTGAGGGEGRDRLDVAAELLAEAGHAELAERLRDRGRPAADFPAGAEDADGAPDRHEEASRDDPHWSDPLDHTDRWADADGPSDRHRADGAAGVYGADFGTRASYADYTADPEGTVTAREFAPTTDTDAADPAHDEHGTRLWFDDGTSAAYGNGAGPVADGARPQE